MLNCVNACPREFKSLGPPSAGPVANDEIVVRAAFAPMHFKNEIVKPAVIQRSSLLKGELSIWRVGNSAEQGALDAVRAKIPTPGNQTLTLLLGVSAWEIRDIRRLDQNGNHIGRKFSVIDDTVIDNQGNRDAQHAAIAPCQEIEIDQAIPDSVAVADLSNQLYLLFKDRQVWPMT